MKPATTLKEILKPPFKWRYGNFISDEDRSLFHFDFDVTFFRSRDAYDAIKDFFVAALNEKWSRDYGERKRWLLKNGRDDIVTCPYCRLDYRFEIFLDWKKNNYCPHCGRRLDPPEEEKWFLG